MLLYCPCVYCHSLLWLYLAILSEIESVLDCCCLCISLLQLEIQLSRVGFGSHEHVKQLHVFVSITCMWSSAYFVVLFVYPMLWGERCWRSPLKLLVSNLKDHFTGFVQEFLKFRIIFIWNLRSYELRRTMTLSSSIANIVWCQSSQRRW
jgi:hypothetical protein